MPFAIPVVRFSEATFLFLTAETMWNLHHLVKTTFTYTAFVLPFCLASTFVGAVPNTTATNLTIPNPGLPEFQCVTDSAWTANRFVQSYCRLAFDYFLTVESGQANSRFEFLAADEASVTSFPRMDTPRRYSMGR